MDGTSTPAITTFSTTGEKLLGNMLSKGKCLSEIAVFSKKHAMKWQKLQWKDVPGETQTIKLDPLINAALNIWVETDAQEAAAKKHAQKAQDLFLDNRVGVRLDWKVRKLSGVQGAPSNAADIVKAGLSDDGFTDCVRVRIDRIKKQPFYIAKTLNVYYVDMPFLVGRNCAIKRVLPPMPLEDPSLEDTCPTKATGDAARVAADITFIGPDANPTTLAHELGHGYGLRPASCGAHTSGPDFPNNIMIPDSDDMPPRTKFTLGQVFRMNFQKDIWGGTILKNIPRNVRRPCSPTDSDTGCPKLEHPWP
jgi:hypothetical protein